MRGMLFIVILIALLIVSFLVMKNISPTSKENGTDKIEMIERAKDTAAKAEEAAQKIKKKAEEIMPQVP